MPEGHTIHRLARHHAPLLAGRQLAVTSPQGRFAEGAAVLDGRLLRHIEPYGKHLFYGFEGRVHLHIHLGLYGKFTEGPVPAPLPCGALRLRITTQEVFVDLRGPTACEVMTPADKAAVLARLGPDPLRPGADREPAWQRISRSRVAIGALLMDQTVLAGVGNVYRAEVLYRHGISPFRPGRELRRDEFDALWEDLVTLLRAGVRAGHIVTTRREDRQRRSGPALRADRFYVYRRAGEPCRRCGVEIRTEQMVGRNLFWCPHDQAR